MEVEYKIEKDGYIIATDKGKLMAASDVLAGQSVATKYKFEFIESLKEMNARHKELTGDDYTSV